MSVKETVLAHELDAGWIIALWLAVRGGDPPAEGPVEIDEVTGLLARAFAARLAETYGRGTNDEVLERLAALGITMGPREVDAPARQCHFVPGFPGAFICVPGLPQRIM